VSLSPDFAAFVGDLFAGLGPVRVKRMFGGGGVYLDDVMIALIAGETLYMRTDEALAAEYAAAGSEPFVYEGRGKPVTMPYWRLPDSALDDPEEAVAWARRSLIPARRAAAKKRAVKAQATRG